MAPDLALESLRSLPANSSVLDPMSGSGTVLRQATELGHSAYGFDVDPLSVLMARVWTSPANDQKIGELNDALLGISGDLRPPPLEGFVDTETCKFIRYWFCQPQIEVLTRLSSALSMIRHTLDCDEDRLALDVLSLNLSRIIVTKEQCASLARDTSHSRPHRVALTSSYDIYDGYARSLKQLRERLKSNPAEARVEVDLGDARRLDQVASKSIDAVVTSPPYLNAIDYLRGHRMALVWLGWSISSLRKIRSGSIGAERAPDPGANDHDIQEVVDAMLEGAPVASRHLHMIRRYACDLQASTREVARVLKDGACATFVIGNSCLKGTFIKNAEGVAQVARTAGLREVARSVRDLPLASRYLPVTGITLAKRMRTETVLTFQRA
ncbi:hypothetical protein [Phenylobacterium sp.]|uniref:hypothetical protein n=1 Tax=Phenylobacterium sp. TaxID=1871053 RepID=UPI0025F0508B|nr:hypothetical protein [Phenylobacterium sp.]